ncbi:MAG: hypothetical protein UW64_C0029G0002 [Microgenomates group bacterium GW2011_GWC1_44_37]|nr:MAG: hypothetical protein UW64_C0029G0002 [Microgenomates group bacterium GW2011_GWC1_44_37]
MKKNLAKTALTIFAILLSACSFPQNPPQPEVFVGISMFEEHVNGLGQDGTYQVDCQNCTVHITKSAHDCPSTFTAIHDGIKVEHSGEIVESENPSGLWVLSDVYVEDPNQGQNLPCPNGQMFKVIMTEGGTVFEP